MDIGEVVLNGNNEAWVPWKADVEVCLRYLSPADDREMLKKIQRPQFIGHQKQENQIDLAAMRDYFVSKVIKGIRGLTKDGEPFEPTPPDLKRIWDGNHEFGLFCVEASRQLTNFIAEKKLEVENIEQCAEQFFRHLGPNCCLYRSSIPRQGLPDCGHCRVANAYHDLDSENVYPFGLFQKYLAAAIVNPFPMATEPVLLLDMAVVRFVLEAEGIPKHDWSEFVDKFQAVHRARELTRG